MSIIFIYYKLVYLFSRKSLISKLLVYKRYLDDVLNASMLELVDRWFLSNHDAMLYGFNSHYLYITLNYLKRDHSSTVEHTADNCSMVVRFPLVLLILNVLVYIH